MWLATVIVKARSPPAAALGGAVSVTARSAVAAGDPSDAEVKALYEKYKDVLPDPARDTPGFKVPRKVKLEVLTADVPAIAKAIQAKLTEAELKA